MGKVFRKPKAPDPVEVARAQQKVQEEIVAEQKAKDEASAEAAQVKFASSEERKRQLKRKGRRTMIATPYGYLGDTTEFGTTGSLLT